MKQLALGTLVTTRGVHDEMTRDSQFAEFVLTCIARHNNAKEKYRAKFGVYPINKTEMVRRSDMICAKFVDTADTLIQRMENEK